MKADGDLSQFNVSVPRKLLLEDDGSSSPSLSRRVSNDLWSLLERSQACTEEQLPSAHAVLVRFAKLCPELLRVQAWHRIAAVNSVTADARAMGAELCDGTSPSVELQVHSGWREAGVRLQVRSLRAGYCSVTEHVLEDLELNLERRSKTGLLGPAGSGKSTLLLSLVRLLEVRSGRILVEGVSIDELGLTALRQLVALVPSDPVLFSGTLRHNLDPLGRFSTEELLRALARMGLEGMKLDREACLSGGERQLVHLARMVLQQPAVLLLDEATCALGPKRQREAMAAVVESLPLSTVVAASQRVESLLALPRMVVLEQGRVVEHGKVSELAEVKGGCLNRVLSRLPDRSLLAPA